MKLLAIVSSFIIVQAKVAEDLNIKIQDICYEKEVLHDGLASYHMAVDRASNTIYFSHGDGGGDGDDGETPDTGKAAKLNLDTKEFETIEGIGTGFTQAVDPKTQEVYFSGDNGIYKYDTNAKRAELLLKDATVQIWSIFFKETLYYSIIPFQYVYTFADGKSTRFEDMKGITVDDFIIDNEDDMFYTNRTGLYSQKKGTKDAVLFRDFKKQNEIGNGLNMDVNGNVYICLEHGIYLVKKATKTLEKFFDIYDLEGKGIAFDRDNNIIYGDRSKIIRLKPNKTIAC